jgi:Arp2/3 complex, 34 kD subunit p34-Arc
MLILISLPLYPTNTVKCSKAYMHSRMRHRVAEFLKVLNRAKPEQAEKERKTARYVRKSLLKLTFLKLTLYFSSFSQLSGRTFRRA